MSVLKDVSTLTRLFGAFYSEKSENIIGLDSYILNSFSYLSPI